MDLFFLTEDVSLKTNLNNILEMYSNNKCPVTLNQKHTEQANSLKDKILYQWVI